MLRIGIIGGSGIAATHAAAIQSHAARARLVAVAEIDPARRAAFAQRWEVAGYAGLEDLLAQADVDAVVLCLPHWLHAPAAIAAARAGKHLLVEKPLATTLAECDAMIAAAAAAGVTLMVGLTRRFYPGVIAGQELIAAGAIGQPIAAEARFLKDWNVAKRAAWHKDRARGGGMWLGNGVHIVDGLAVLLQSEFAAVRGAIERRVYPIEADDFGFAWFDLRNGAHATAMAFGYRTGVYQDSITVIGTDGFVRCERATAQLGRDDRWTCVDLRARWPAFAGNDGAIAFHLEWRAFLDALEQRAAPPITGRYGRHIVAALLAAEESTRSGGVATIGA